MDQIGAVADRQAHGAGTQGIVRARGDRRRQDIAILGVLVAHRLGRMPPGIFLFGNHMRQAQRRAPVHLADADRIGDHLLRHVPLRLRKVVEPMLGDIDDDARVRAGRQDVPARE